MPTDVNHGHAAARTSARSRFRTVACAGHPQRFVRRPPTPRALPTNILNQSPIATRRRGRHSRNAGHLVFQAH